MCSRRPRSLLVLTVAHGLLLAALTFSVSAADAPAATLSAAREDLASRDFATREAATRLLWKNAEGAASLLQDALRSEDAEVRLRAERIWEAFQMGILPDTPRDVVEQIYEFHDGSFPRKQEILRELVAGDNLKTAYRLLEAVDDQALRGSLTELVTEQLRLRLWPHLLNEEWDQADRILQNAAQGDPSMRDYAAFLLLSGRLSDTASSDVQDLRWRTWLLRASDQLPAAIQQAAQQGNLALERELRAAAGDALAVCQAQLADTTASPVESLRAQAFHARLSGDQAALDVAIQALLDLARNETNSFTKQQILHVLLLNDVVEPTLPLLPKLVRQTAFDVQTYRGLYGDAMKQIGLENARPPYHDWVEKRRKTLAEQPDDNTALQEMIDLAQRIHGLGETQEAARILDLAFVTLGDDSARRLALVTNELQIGLRDLGEKHLRQVAAEGVEPAQLHGILPFRGDLKELLPQWAGFFMKQAKAPDQELEALIQAWKLVDVEDGEPHPKAGELLDQAYANLPQLPINEKTSYLYNLYLTATLHEETGHARRFLEELVQMTNESVYAYLLGNLHAETESWDEAATAFEKAWEGHRQMFQASLLAPADTRRRDQGRMQLQPRYLYLAGLAHAKAGRVERGNGMIDHARLLCLGDLEMHYLLARAMEEYQDHARAHSEWELIARLSLMDEPVGAAAFYFLADAAAKTDPAQAIAYQERVIVAREGLDLLFRNSQFSFDIRLRSLVHEWQAEAHLKAGEIEAGLRSLEHYWQLTPGNASIGEELLPLLESAGKPQEAKDYYEKTRTLAAEACRLFPQSAMAHNNLAWLLARTRRNLDEALTHANTAVALEPETAAYLDTLAEVYFAMGNREKALELSDKAVLLTPDDEELLGQRQRFLNAPLPDKRASSGG